MARRPDPYLTDVDNPVLTDEDFTALRPAAAVLPAIMYRGLVAGEPKRKPGQRGPGRKPAKVPVTIRLEPETLAAFKATGTGWQSRVSGILRDVTSGRIVPVAHEDALLPAQPPGRRVRTKKQA